MASLQKVLLNIGLQEIDMRKGEMILIKSESGKGIDCPIIDVEGDKIWVRFPTSQVIEMTYNSKSKVYVGKLARIEFTAKPNDS